MLSVILYNYRKSKKGMVIRMKITHDFHIHTGLSLCADPETKVSDFFEPAIAAGLDRIGISNHFWDENIPPLRDDGYFTMQNFERLSREEELIRNERSIKVSFGCEADYDYIHRDVAMTEETAEKFDHILVPNSHTHLVMPEEYWDDIPRHKEFLLTAYTDIIRGKISKYITAIAHPFDVVGYPKDKLKALIDSVSDDEFKRIFDETAERGIAYELNVGGGMQNSRETIESFPTLRLARLAKECGCKFIFGSDAHAAREWRYYIENATLTAEIIGITEDDICDFAKK